MKEHLLAWLRAHPERSRDWLKRMLGEGFQVHHVDGDHSNDHPGNLALIENVDHMRLHGLFGLARPDIRLAAAKGGRSRMAKMTPTERSKHCQNMANARWKKVRRANKAKRKAAAHRAANAEKEAVL